MGNIHIESCPVCGQNEWKEHLKVKDHSISGDTFSLLQCQVCTFVITQDQPDVESIGPYYVSEDYISHSDTQKGLINRLYHNIRNYMLDQKKKWVEANVENVPGRLLDIGCGTGYFLSHMVQNGWQGKGLEPDDKARQMAIDQFSLDVQYSDHLFSMQEKFDVISMWHVLEHVHQLNEYFDAFKDRLNAGGLLLIAVPNYTSGDAERYQSYWAAYDVPRHLWHFSPQSMHTLMEKHGFEIKKKYGMRFDPYYVAMLSEKYKGGSMGTLKGAFAGLRSNAKASGNVDRNSSIVYIAKKKK